jgi:hypothetical protein
VSGSSGRLIVERSPAETEPGQWPDRVFEDPALTYEEAMLGFVTASQAEEAGSGRQAEAAEPSSLKAKKRTLQREEARLRDERRHQGVP